MNNRSETREAVSLFLYSVDVANNTRAKIGAWESNAAYYRVQAETILDIVEEFQAVPAPTRLDPSKWPFITYPRKAVPNGNDR